MSSLRKKFGVTVRCANIVLVTLGLASLALYRFGLRAEGTENIVRFILVALGQGLLYFVAAWLVWHTAPARSTLAIVILFAALFRFSVLFAAPNLSTDIYRYIWDGRVQGEGINPYRYVPSDERVAHLRDDTIYPRINRRDYAHTIYPPVAQAIYFAVTRVSDSVTWMKAAMVLFEAAALWVLILLLTSFGLPRERALGYAWHPLLVWEIAGNGHVDAAAIAFIALALLGRRHRKESATGVALALATLVKLYPAMLFPALYRRWGWRMPVAFAATVLIAYLPYLDVRAGVVGFLPGYIDEEGLRNGERFFLLNLARRVMGEAALANLAFVFSAVLALLAVAAWSFWSQEGAEISYVRRALALAASFTLLLSPHYSWYYAWLVPFLCFAPVVPLFYVTASSFVLYGTWRGDQPGLVLALNAAIFAPFALLWIVELWKRGANVRKGRGRGSVSELPEQELMTGTLEGRQR